LLLVAVWAAPARADSVRDASWYLNFLGVAAAQQVTQGDGQTVAVIDTGVDANHPDLTGNVLPGLDAYNEQGKGQQDTNGHGTQMASLIAGHGHGTNAGVLGIAPKAKILPINVTTPKSPLISPTVVGQAIRYAADHGATVICVALSSSFDTEQENAVKYAYSKNVLVVAAAGNTSTDVLIASPAALKEAVAVGAVDRNGNHAAISLTGPELDISAPGVDIEAASLGRGYAKISGTSPATAIVAGTVALIRASHPKSDAVDQVRRLVWTSTGKGAPPPGRDDTYGWGVLNVQRAVSGEPSTPPSAVPETTQAMPQPIGTVRANHNVGLAAFRIALVFGPLLLIAALVIVLLRLRRRRA
jgi:type VII secretion-associated serine protease mycosin